MKSLLSLVMLLSLFSPRGAAAENEWELKKSEDGIAVSTRRAPGFDIKEFKAVVRYPARLEKVAELVSNPKGLDTWYDNFTNSAVLQKHDRGFIFYYEVKTPFPYSNRDAINKSFISKRPGEVFVQLMNLPKHIPEKSGLVRMPRGRGSWRMRQIDEQTVEVEHRFLADPGGHIPGWLANLFVVDGPLNSLKALRDKTREKTQTK